ncbi:MAG: ATP-binding protein, partial [Candidatus Binataceae bacterium]
MAATGEGRGRLFLISGEPGIGKTRLAEQISSEASQAGVRVIWGRCWEGGGATAYWPIIQILRGCAEHPDFALAVETLGDAIQYLASLVPEIIPALSAPQERTGSYRADPEQARFRLFDAVARLLKTLATSQPLLLVIDDLHDADTAVLRMLTFVARALKDTPILLVGTHREAEVERSPEFRSQIAELARESDQLRIGGLSLAESAELVGSRTGIAPREQFIAALHDTTEGNPLFLGGVVEMLASEGKLAHQERLTAADLKLPATVRGAIGSRLSNLSQDASAALRVAAVIGVEFEMALLQLVVGTGGEELLASLDEAVVLGIIRGVAGTPAAFRFTHPLFRSVTYDAVGGAERARLHKRVGEALEAGGDDSSVHLANIANHYRLAIPAGMTEKAITYSIRAGEAAEAVYAYEDAMFQFETALTLMNRHAGINEVRADLLVRLGLLLQQHDTRLGIEHLESAVALYEGLNLVNAAARVRELLGHILASEGQRRDIPRALYHLRRAEAVLGLGQPSPELGDLYCGLAQAEGLQGSVRKAHKSLTRAMDIAEQLKRDDLWCASAAPAAEQLVFAGRIREAHLLISRTKRQLFAITDPPHFFRTIWSSGACHQYVWNRRSAQEWFKRGLESPLPSKFHRDVMHVQMAANCFHLGELSGMRQHLADSQQFDECLRALSEEFWAREAGDLERAKQMLEAELEPGDLKFGSLATRYGQQRTLACILRELGDSQKSEEYLRSLLVDYNNGEPLPHLEMTVRPEFALSLVATGDLVRALSEVRRCHEIIAAGEDWHGLVGHYHRASGACAAAKGLQAEAEHQFALAIEAFRRNGLVWEEAYVLRLWGRALTIAGHVGSAREKFAAAVEIYRRIGAGQAWTDRTLAEKSHATNAPDSEVASRYAGGVFRRDGEFWTISYQGTSASLRDRGGMRLIAMVLSRPGEPISAVEMFAAHGANAGTGEQATGLRKTFELGDAGEQVDARALEEYRRRIAEL